MMLQMAFLGGMSPQSTLISFALDPIYPVAGAGVGKKWQKISVPPCWPRIRRNAVAPSTERAYRGYFGLWVEFHMDVVYEPVFQS